MRGSDRIEILLNEIYGAALAPSRWHKVLADTANIVGGRMGLLIISADPDSAISTPISYEVDPSLLQRWVSGYLEQDLWSHGMHGYDEGFVLTGASVSAPEITRRSAWYNELLVHGRIEDCLSTSIAKQGEVHTVVSIYSDEWFPKPSIRLMQHLSPHLRRALRVQKQLGQITTRAGYAEQVLDALAAGVLALDAFGRVKHMNARAEAIVRMNDGLAIRNQRLHAARIEENALLNTAIARAGGIGVPVEQPLGTTLSISRPSLLRPFGLEITPVHFKEGHASPLLLPEKQFATVIVTVSDPESIDEADADRLARLFRLTPAEARLAAALAARQSLEDYASRAGVSIGTARWTLKRVLEKTGCRRQSELVQIVATSVLAFKKS